jgi:Flp pilus assembly protein TadD
VLAGQGLVDEAIGHFSEALKVQPDYAEAHNNLGVVLAGQGRVEEAVSHFAAALKIKPEYTAAENNLNRSLQVLGKSSSGSDTIVGD